MALVSQFRSGVKQNDLYYLLFIFEVYKKDSFQMPSWFLSNILDANESKCKKGLKFSVCRFLPEENLEPEDQKVRKD